MQHRTHRYPKQKINLQKCTKPYCNNERPTGPQEMLVVPKELHIKVDPDGCCEIPIKLRCTPHHHGIDLAEEMVYVKVWVTKRMNNEDNIISDDGAINQTTSSQGDTLVSAREVALGCCRSKCTHQNRATCSFVLTLASSCWHKL